MDMYYTMRSKDGREIKTYSKTKVFFLWLRGWKRMYKFEGSA